MRALRHMGSLKLARLAPALGLRCLSSGSCHMQAEQETRLEEYPLRRMVLKEQRSCLWLQITQLLCITGRHTDAGNWLILNRCPQRRAFSADHDVLDVNSMEAMKFPLLQVSTLDGEDVTLPDALITTTEEEKGKRLGRGQ